MRTANRIRREWAKCVDSPDDENYVVAYPIRISRSWDADGVAVEPGHGFAQRHALQASQPEFSDID